MEKIAMVVQRYGLEVNGGSEYSCRMIAEQLSNDYEVEVLTTKALDYTTWKNYYKHDIETINKTKVRRFSTNYPRNKWLFNLYNKFVLKYKHSSPFHEIEWIKRQGPVSLDLLDYIKQHQDEYDVFIFFTYLYFPTYFGMQLVPEKSIFIPTAHDEPYIHFSVYKPTFHLPRYIMYLTPEEQNFVQNTFHNKYIPSEVCGFGIAPPKQMLTEQTAREKFKIAYPYVIYVGRIDQFKGCDELFTYFIKYKEESKRELKLLLIGKPFMNIPNHPDIIHVGFLSEEEKFGLIAGSECLIMPSKYESLSIVVLESLFMKRPVLVNGDCAVLKGHCERSKAGLYYTSYDEFALHLTSLVEDKEYNNRLGLNGEKYIQLNYTWSQVVEKFKIAIESMTK